MKKTIALILVALITSVNAMAMSNSSIRTHARFLADRMAYELDLTPSQYDDCYEINYDFIYSVNRIMNDVVRGYTDAINMYYLYLDYRNDDLRYVLTTRQYSRFMMLDYFYRPIYTNGRDWNFRVYTIYSNRTFYYYDAPRVYKHYAGAHNRGVNNGNGYYTNRHGNDHYNGNDHRISNGTNMNNYRRGDFGTNLKERNNPTQNRQNDYSNKNEKNRTQNEYYRDNSNNKNAPAINNRDNRTSTTQNNSRNNGGQFNGTRNNSRGENNSRTENGSAGNGSVKAGRR